jgi:hypothetical protein
MGSTPGQQNKIARLRQAEKNPARQLTAHDRAPETVL